MAIRDAVLALTDEYEVMTVRQVFYALTVRGIVPKDENAGYRPVQTHVLKMRREGLLPWRFISDGTRWVRNIEMWDSTADAIRETQATYRRNLWRSQKIRIEVWLEKDALAGVVAQATNEWRVPLLVSRGQASDTYCHSAAQAAADGWHDAGIRTLVYALYDSDSYGRNAAEKIREKLHVYSGGANIQFELLAVTDEQITEWNLPTRPDKKDKARDVVELDAVPPDRLVSLVSDAIVEHVDQTAWEMEKVVEESERQQLLWLLPGVGA